MAGHHRCHLRRAGPPHGAWVALPAFVASRIMCRSLVSTMVDHFSLAIGTPSQPIMAECDARTDDALARLVF